MVPGHLRARSTASTITCTGSNRPRSAASTLSNESAISQPDQPRPTEALFQVQPQIPSALWQMSQEEVLARVSHIPTASNGYILTPSMQHMNQHAPLVPFPTDANIFNDPNMRIHSPVQFTSVEGRESTAFDTGNEAAGPEEAGGDIKSKKKGSASSQANDLELRRLFRENEARDLHEIALQVLREDKGPKSEKSKQIFGMIWLFTHVKRSNSSVPRNRVFTSYANRCATERVPPLNSASFGKLVRIIFPNIQTRRLGVRGESKYHYVDLSLIHDDGRQSVPRAMVDGVGPQDQVPKARNMNIRPQLPADTACFPPADLSGLAVHNSRQSHARMNSTTVFLQTPAVLAGQQLHALRTNVVKCPLQFPTTPIDFEGASGKMQLDLPSIEPYLPPGADPDAVSLLTAVYRSHCMLAIDNFRYCKIDQLCDTYKSLISLLTVPSQELLAHPKVAEWIRRCDWLKYQKMVPFLDYSILMAVGPKLLQNIIQVSQNLGTWINQFFHNQPQHVQDAMLGPASVFVSLLQRYLRVHKAAQKANEVLEDAESRNLLWLDWCNHVDPWHVIQETLKDLGDGGAKRVLHIMTQDARFLLSPLKSPPVDNVMPLFRDNGVLSSFQAEELRLENAGIDDSPFTRFVRFIDSLPIRFPNVPVTWYLRYLDAFSSNVATQFTLKECGGVLDWFKISTFLTEYTQWNAEKGGFLENGPSYTVATKEQTYRSPYEHIQGSFNCNGLEDVSSSRPDTAMSTKAEEHRMSAGMTRTNGQLPPQFGSNQPKCMTQQSKVMAFEARSSLGGSTAVGDDDDFGPVNEDSGIALDDDFGMDAKGGSYHFIQGHHGSDPTDVVVC